MVIKIIKCFYYQSAGNCIKFDAHNKLYGRKNLGTGILANLTDGGDGTIGIEFSQERKDKISKANKGNKFALGSIRSEEFRKNIGLRVSKFFQNKENRERQNCGKRNSKNSPRP